MKIRTYGNKESSIVIIQPMMENENIPLELEEVMFISIIIDDWNQELSPWHCKAVFGKQDFGDGAKDTLNEILKLCNDPNKHYYLGGYSLAGMFSLWCATQTNVFKGIIACSPSVWFVDFVEYIKGHSLQTDKVYLSLGKQESKTRNKVMATVSDRIQECKKILDEQNIPSVLEWNDGNHFTDPEGRMKKGYRWILKDVLTSDIDV